MCTIEKKKDQEERRGFKSVSGARIESAQFCWQFISGDRSTMRNKSVSNYES